MQKLVFTRIVDAPRDKVFAAWTDPVQLRQWLTPTPWTVTVVQADPRPGAASMLLMSEPEAGELMTVVVTFEDVHGGTRYTARVRHWTNTEREVEVE